MKKTSQLCFLSAAMMALASPAVQAQEPATQSKEVLDAVSVSMKRDSTMRPYGRVNEVLSMVQRYGQGLFRLEFTLGAKDPKVPLPAKPKLAVVHADAFVPIPIEADGSFQLPVLPKEQAKDAEFASNIPKGTANMRGKILLTVKPEQLDMAMVRKVMKTARTMRSEILPWYLRWAFPQFDGVRVCSNQTNWELEWPDSSTPGQLLSIPLSADSKDMDPEESDAAKKSPAARRQCSTITGEERWPDNARLVAPADTSLSVRLSGQP
ncbi:hypothetical protein [Roseateles sp.]|uniref:hypothetical protein n=1 Tax=Roseateles sp. TaxID=1971397 RepID=UPI003BA65826